MSAPLPRLPKKNRAALEEQLRQSSVYKRITLKNLIMTYVPWIFDSEVEIIRFLLQAQVKLGGKPLRAGPNTEVELVNLTILSITAPDRRLVLFISNGEVILNDHFYNGI